MRLGRGHTPVDCLEDYLLERDATLDELRLHLIKAQQRMKASADKKRRAKSFETGEWVYLKLQPYRQKSLAKGPFEKLAARFYGPFRVI